MRARSAGGLPISVSGLEALTLALDRLEGEPAWIVEAGVDQAWVEQVITAFDGAEVRSALCLRTATILAASPTDSLLLAICRAAGIGADQACDVLLVVTELIANAVFHGNLEDHDPAFAPAAWFDRGIAFISEIAPAHLAISVMQEYGQPRAAGAAVNEIPADVPFDQASGRGMLIVSALADEFRVTRDGRGCRVGFAARSG